VSEKVVADEREYLRPDKRFPSLWCPGCGIGIIESAIIRAVASLGLDRNQVAMVSGIGCSGRMPIYVDFYGLHTTHGRALAFATGLKMAQPKLKIIVVMGDGDAVAIGGNHFLHAARRNIDLTVIVVNNQTYGLTSGQYSPTTPRGARTTTSRYGNIENPLDISALAAAVGASFVARSTVYHALEMEKFVRQALQKKGFALVECISNCHVHFGRLNQMPTAVEMLNWQKDNTISIQEVQRRHGGQVPQGKITRGVLVDRELPEYVEEYQKLLARAQQAARVGP